MGMAEAEARAALDALAVDNALRSTSVHATAGAGLAIVLLSLSLQLTNVATNLVSGPVRTATVGLAWGCALAALAAWARIGRPRRAPTPAAGRPAAPDGDGRRERTWQPEL